MSAETGPTLKIMALGRPFQLGTLYDLKTDRIVSNKLLWDDKLISKYRSYRSSSSTSCEIHTEDNFTKIWDPLGMDTNLKMSAITGLVELSGSAKLIHTRKTTQHKRCFILKYSVTTRRYELPVEYLSKTYAKNQEAFDQQIATHVVGAIIFGVEVYFIFNRASFNGEHHEMVDRSVIKLLEKMMTLRLSNNVNLDLNDNEKKLAETLTCQYYGDFDLISNPTTFEQAAEIFKQLPKLLGENQEHTVPKQVWLYPLHLLDERSLRYEPFVQINSDLVNKSVKLFERLHQLAVIVNDLRSSLPPTIFFHQIEEHLLLCHTRIYEFETNMKRQMRKLLPEIRGGITNEITLANLLQNIDMFSINKRKVDNWIHFITEGIRILIDFFNDLSRQVNINISNLLPLEAKNNLNSQIILRLIIHIIEKNDPFLNEMFRYLNSNNKGYVDQNSRIGCWFDQDHFALLRRKVALYAEFAEVNRTKENIKFIVDEQYADDFQSNKNVSIILYRNGVSTNFEIPSRPGQPRATNISNQRVTLDWSKPTSGSESVQQYKVYVHVVGSNQWVLLATSADTTQSAVISNLMKGKYQFKIQGITLAGDTAESDASDVIDIVTAAPAMPVPRPPIAAPSPIITANTVTSEKATIDVTPAWFEPIKPVSPDKIRLPASYNKNSPTDVRTYNCLATYRSMTEKTGKIDFVAKPFTSAVDDTETLVVVLNEFANQLGTRLTFTNADFKYNDSDYRTACGVTNLGSIHSFLASEGQCQTAKFDLHLKLDYDDITASPETLKNFVLRSINDIASIAGCNKEFVRVFGVSRASSLLVGFGITAPQLEETKRTAEFVKEKLNKPSTRKRKDIFQYMFQEQYDYKLEAALTFLQLQKSDFEPSHNRDYPKAGTDRRGGHPYYFPQGWYRHALKVVDKYPQDRLWLGMENLPGEWAVAYHGTSSGGVRSITNKGLLHEAVIRDVCKNEAKQQNSTIPNVKGLYVATHCEGGASDYANAFEVKDSTGAKKEYKVVFQCRVQPGKFTVHKSPVKVGMAWRVFDEKAIRPYGLLLKVQNRRK